jgi:hypothetical protein
MTHPALTAAIVAWLLLAPALTWAQVAQGQAPTPPSAPAGQIRVLSDSERAAQRAALEAGGASGTREDLWEILRQYSPALSEVLQRDPTLLDRADYLAPYPLLVDFLERHPEIRRSPSYYFGESSFREFRVLTPEERAIRSFDSMVNTAGVLLGITVLVSMLVWVIRTVVDHRRWLRQSRVQVDVHSKILDRMASNEDLLAYAKTPAGSRFLEAGPIDLGGATPVTPLGRIIWSVQAGVVLIALGLGLWIAQIGLMDEVRQGLGFIATIAVSLGVGFVASAAVAYKVSSRVGLLPAKES